jgi:hypothetical protein
MKCFLLLLCFLPFFSKGQESSLEIGILGGTTFYVGDLSGSLSDFSPKDLGYTGGIFLRQHFNRHLGLRIGLQLAHVASNELNRKVPNPRALNFYNNLKQAHLLGEWRIINVSLAGDKIRISPFFTTGGTIQLSDPYFNHLTYGKIPLRLLGTEGQGIMGYPDYYKPYVFSLPAGAGLAVSLNEKINLTAEIIGNRVFGDYLDDVSSAPVIFNDLLAHPKGSSLALNAYISNPTLYPSPSAIPYSRGGPAVDWYYLIQVSLGYQIRSGNSYKSGGSRGLPCPTFK